MVFHIILHYQFHTLEKNYFHVIINHFQFKSVFLVCLKFSVEDCSILFQHFVIKDPQSNDIIHTTIQTAGNNINPINKKFSIQNIHLQSVRSFETLIIVLYIFFLNLKQVPSNLSVSHIHKESKKCINNNQKSAKLVKNKIEPVNVMETYGHDQAVEKVTLIYDRTRKSNLSVYSSYLITSNSHCYNSPKPRLNLISKSSTTTTCSVLF
jgi:hypothetical protein